jgi:uncharacterized protein
MKPTAEEIHNRKQDVSERMPEVMRAIDLRFAPFRRQFDARLANALGANGSRRSKIFAIQRLSSEVRQISSPFAACKRGCSNCCYQRVMLSQTEADTIAHNIKRKAVQLSPAYRLPDMDAFDSTTACNFLVDGECSIYEHRPFMCRNQVNLDKDSLLCSFENWELGKANSPMYTGIPMQDPGPLLVAYRQVSSHDIIGDIRDFFPANR